jgi:hypothetical protein
VIVRINFKTIDHRALEYEILDCHLELLSQGLQRGI